MRPGWALSLKVCAIFAWVAVLPVVGLARNSSLARLAASRELGHSLDRLAARRYRLRFLHAPRMAQDAPLPATSKAQPMAQAVLITSLEARALAMGLDLLSLRPVGKGGDIDMSVQGSSGGILGYLGYIGSLNLGPSRCRLTPSQGGLTMAARLNQLGETIQGKSDGGGDQAHPWRDRDPFGRSGYNDPDNRELKKADRPRLVSKAPSPFKGIMEGREGDGASVAIPPGLRLIGHARASNGVRRFLVLDAGGRLRSPSILAADGGLRVVEEGPSLVVIRDAEGVRHAFTLK